MNNGGLIIINIIAALFFSSQPASSPDVSGSAKSVDAVVAQSPQTAFTAGNIIVCRVGNGSGALGTNAAPVFLDQYSPTGTLVSSVALPTTASGTNKPLTLSGNSLTECQLGRSPDGTFFILAGYAAVTGTASVSTTQTSIVPRVIGRVDIGGVVDTSTTTTSFNFQPVRSATTNNGIAFWATGQGSGIVYQALGGSGTGTAVAINPPVNGSIAISGGQLYTASTGPTAISTVGNGLPTTTGQSIAPLAGAPGAGQPSQFFFADLDANTAGNDTLYVADLGSATGPTGGGVKKYLLQGGTWNYTGTFPADFGSDVLASQFVGLSGTVSGTTVTLFATRMNSQGLTQLVKLTDATGYGGMPVDAPTLLATALSNTAFRGVAMVPPPPNPGKLQLSSNRFSGPENAASLPITVTRSGGSAGAVSVSYTLAGGDATGGAACNAGVDYINTGGVINFAAGDDAPKTINVPLCNDAVYEGDETFTVALSNATGGATVGPPSSAVVTIGEDDPHNSIFTVNSGGDSGDGVCDATCTLRDAIAAANADAIDSRIVFNIPVSDPACNADGTCTITLANTRLTINAAASAGKLTISNVAGAKKLIISGGNRTDVFFNDGDLTLDGVTITNGFSPIYGGGINNYHGNLTIINSIVTNNSSQPTQPQFCGGGIYSKGVLSIGNSTISNNSTTSNGGAICLFSGSATITNSTISGNSGTAGGGIGYYNDQIQAQVTISDSTISGNTAMSNGGGIYNGFMLSFENVTVTDNSTTAGNGSGGGVFAGGNFLNFTSTNSLIAGNRSTNVRDVFGPINGTNNLIGDGTGMNGVVNGSGGNLVGTGSSPIDPKLGPLQNNGGSTITHALLAASPAIDAGDPNLASPPQFDQRGTGFARIIDGNNDGVARIDIGAFEAREQTSVPHAKTAFDFDGDGKADEAVWRPSNGTWYLNRSQAGFTGYQFGAAGDLLTPADFTGDGKTDVSVFRNGTWFIMRSEDNTFFGAQFGSAGDLPAPGDYDGDGKADTVVFRPSTGTWFIQGSTAGFSAVRFGVSGDVPTVGDYDGDGKSDVAVFRGSNGAWYRLNSSNGSFYGDQFGQSGDKVVPADYTGDGKTDLAIWRPSNGTWYIMRSEDNSFYGAQFGVNGDLPAPADFDGDGKADTAVFRPSTGTWFEQRSTTGFAAVGFGVDGDKPASGAFAY